MNEKYINALERQKEKLDQQDFNLDSWKTSTAILLDRIFGDGNSKTEEIKKMHDDKSSWSLRDTQGIPGIELCKKQGREILDVCITEIELFGIDDKKDYIKPEFISSIIKENLKNSQYMELKDLLKSDKSKEIKQQLLIEFFKDIEIKNELLADILVHEQIINTF
jgi:hypothetical protein